MTPYSGLITGGLGLDACQYMLTYHFHLFPLEITVITPTGGGGGGPYPYPAWNRLEPGQAKNFYKPVNPNYYTQQRRGKKQQYVFLKIAFKDKKYERHLLVDPKTANSIVNAAKFATKVAKRFHIVASKFYRKKGDEK